MTEETERQTLSRRQMLGTTAAVAAAGAAGVAGGAVTSRSLVTPAEAQPQPSARSAVGPNKTEVKPGDLDEYYVFFSAVARAAKSALSACHRCANSYGFRCSTADSATGWGQTDQSP